jgi:hypothetical protein
LPKYSSIRPGEETKQNEELNHSLYGLMDLQVARKSRSSRNKSSPHQLFNGSAANSFSGYDFLIGWIR